MDCQRSCCWYLRYPLSYRDLEELMIERGLHIDHTTIYRWVQHYAPELQKRCQPYLKMTNDSWRVDETYVKVKKRWMYLYRAVDSQGNTLEFLLTSPPSSKPISRSASCKRRVNLTRGNVRAGKRSAQILRVQASRLQKKRRTCSTRWTKRPLAGRSRKVRW